MGNHKIRLRAILANVAIPTSYRDNSHTPGFSGLVYTASSLVLSAWVQILPLSGCHEDGPSRLVKPMSTTHTTSGWPCAVLGLQPVSDCCLPPAACKPHPTPPR